MIRVLVELQALTLRGRVVRSLRLLRQPKYLVGAVVGTLWMLTWVGRPLLRANTPLRAGGIDRIPGPWADTASLGVALAVTLAMLLPWLLPWGRPGLRFREAELTMLLQAPLARRQVIGYGLLKAGIGTVVTATLLSLVLGPLHFPGLLALFAFWGLNAAWRSMFLLEQREHPRAVARRAIVTAVAGGYAAVLIALASRFIQLLVASGATSPPAAPRLLTALLLPGRLLTAPLLAQGTAKILVAALPVAILALVQLEIVLRSRAPFEEASLEWAKANDERGARGRRGSRARGKLGRHWQVFELKGAGRAEVAIVWKNLMRVSRIPMTRAIASAALLLVALVAIAWIVPVYPAIYGVLAGAGLFTAATAPVFGGMSWTNDLRTELQHLELVRTWPVAPFRFVLAEVVSSASLSTLVGMFGLGVALAGTFGAQISAANGVPLRIFPVSGTLGVSTTGLVLLGLPSFVPLLAGAAFAISALQNTATLFIPAWMVQTADTQRGIAAVGRNTIVGTAMFLGVAIALIPSALLVGLAMLIQRWMGLPWSAWAFPLWGVLAAVPLFGLGVMLIGFATKLWSALDPSQELLEIGR
ncbi:MAG TPA: putative ABC exporter domain-containing protein [Candidatus Polarisedimenticolaceae bacterium]|nr:putative ABC exporter domain-containing protein [Candidatus Polarisedimenticolaceae bacterium]